MDAVADSRTQRLPPGAVRHAVRVTFVQVMLGAVYSASTGGMFLIGYALLLGAGNVQIGLMSTIPMLCVVVQLATAAVVERGVSRRKLAFAASVLNVSGWLLVILIPYAAAKAGADTKVAILIGIITAVTLFANVAGNARGSWVGDLIPARFRGTFFGRTAMYGGIVAMVFAVAEGWFLDFIKGYGVGAFSVLFGFGMAFGLGSAFLFLSQADVPIRRAESGVTLLQMVRATFTNRALMVVLAFHIIMAMQAVAGPFYATYMLRDLKISFLGVGLISAVFMIAFLVSSPLWGKAVDRWGCKPVLIASAAVLGPIQLVWLWMDTSTRVCIVIPFINILAGCAGSGLNVGLSALIFKVTPSVGRSVQLALYSIVVALLSAPLPSLGGYLPDLAPHLGLPADLRITFYVAGAFILASAFVARRIDERGSRRTRDMIRDLHGELVAPWFRWVE